MIPAVHSYSLRERFATEPGYGIDAFLDRCGADGFRSVEVMTGKAGSPPEHIGTDTVAGLERVVARAAAAGVHIHCYATYNDFAFVPNEAWRLANIAYIKQWTVLAARTGVPNLRLCTGYLVAGEDPARLERLVEEGLKECAEVAEREQVNLAIENHSSVFPRGADIVALIRRIGSPRLTTCPDPSNGFKLFQPDCTPAKREAMYDHLERMAPLATDSHLKVRNGGLKEWDLDRLLGIYRRAGYRGPVTFEWIGEGDPLPVLAEARRTLEAAIARSG